MLDKTEERVGFVDKTKDEVSQAVEWYAVLVFGIVIGSMFAIAVLGSGELARLLALLGGF